MKFPSSTRMLVVIAGAALVAAGCGPSSSETPSATAGVGATQVHVTLTNAGCAPDPETAPAGQVEFVIVNDGGDRVSEVELLQGSNVLTEKENLADGLSGSFTIELEAGDYILECPGADQDEWPFEVTDANG